MQNISHYWQYWLLNNKISLFRNLLNTDCYTQSNTMVSIKIEFVRNLLDILLERFDSNIPFKLPILNFLKFL